MEDGQKRKEMSALYEKDISIFLAKFDLKEKFEKGELLCKFCKTSVTTENIYSILPESGMLNIICDKPECVSKLLLYTEEKMKTKPE